ncbi:ATPase domain-containing protein [uncultured Megamonas sp.]|uniref:ATPase domain-containing protein n=1 Tax=uncultured Megamonas sp. TaxID=286140 RepID=UPI00259B9265|nr:ATPase domain-containing protein [uncultured Megamonas sp.]
MSELQDSVFAMLNQTEGLQAFSKTDNGSVEDYIPSFLPELDKMLGGGGLPVKFISEVYGSASSGKSTLSIQFIKNFQHMEHSYTVYIDVEGTANTQRFIDLGANPERILTLTPKRGKDGKVDPLTIEVIGQKIIDTLAMINQADPKAVVLFIWDSIAVTQSQMEDNTELGSQVVGQQAKALNTVGKKIAANLQFNNGVLLTFNQAREDFNSTLPAQYRTQKTVGGLAWEHLLSTRFLIKSGKKITEKSTDKTGIGKVSKLQVVKNKVSDSWSNTFELQLIGRKGFDIYYNTVVKGQELGLVSSGRFPKYISDNGEEVKGATLIKLVEEFTKPENFDVFRELWQKEVKHYFPNVYPCLFNVHSYFLEKNEPLIKGLRKHYMDIQEELPVEQQSYNYKHFMEKLENKELDKELIDEVESY